MKKRYALYLNSLIKVTEGSEVRRYEEDELIAEFLVDEPGNITAAALEHLQFYMQNRDIYFTEYADYCTMFLKLREDIDVEYTPAFDTTLITVHIYRDDDNGTVS